MLDYSELEYWEKRFSNNASTFDWLKDPEELLPIIRELSKGLPEGDRRLLHIGSGSSTLSLRLRELVRSPSRVFNVDFSQGALEIGRALEHNSTYKSDDPELVSKRMKWRRANLLDAEDVISLQGETRTHGAFNMIVDKSTSDAIACGEPVEMSGSDFAPIKTLSSTYRVHPVWRLALHMAALTEPGALWIVLSYKEDRFYFLDSAAASLDLKGQDIPIELLPGNYWNLKSKQFIVDESPNLERSGGAPVYRPIGGKWLLVLQRSDESLAMKED